MIQNRLFNGVTGVSFKTVLSLIILHCSRFLKVSYIIGSSAALFSVSSVVGPLVGVYGGVATSVAVCAAGLLLRYTLFGITSLHILAFYIPGLCAALYHARPGILTRVALPAACMALFLLHPTGAQAYAYSFYWLLPIALYFIPQKNFFLDALGSTFVAHAVGSVIWLYTLTMPAAVWWGLIPVVALERCVFACGMYLTHKVILFATSAIGKGAFARGVVRQRSAV